MENNQIPEKKEELELENLNWDNWLVSLRYLRLFPLFFLLSRSFFFSLAAILSLSPPPLSGSFAQYTSNHYNSWTFIVNILKRYIKMISVVLLYSNFINCMWYKTNIYNNKWWCVCFLCVSERSDIKYAARWTIDGAHLQISGEKNATFLSICASVYISKCETNEASARQQNNSFGCNFANWCKHNDNGEMKH